jgi:membrane-associated phospholipid phosphatase
MPRVLWICSGAAVLTAAFVLDPAAVVAVTEPVGTPLRAIAGRLGSALDWPWVLGFAALVALVAHLAGHRPMRRTWTAVLVAGAIIGITATTLRSVTGRSRPGAAVEQGWHGPYHEGRWLIGVRDHNAFPSGHTATIAGMAALLIRRRHRMAPVVVALTFLVAWSRMAVGAHRLSDVVASMVLAAVLIRPVEDLLPDIFSRPQANDDAASGSAGLGTRGPLATGNA